jgi:hypothetical protein
MSTALAVDFDNTVVNYDGLIHRVAVEMGLVPDGPLLHRLEVRQRIRKQSNGEIAWQKLQATIYGPRIGEAKLIDGVEAFFQESHRRGYKTYIVSHKTEFSNQGSTSLRSAAMGWMRDHRFFQKRGLGLSPGDIYFEGTRIEKLSRVKTLGCSVLIDDLEELFREESFPADVGKVLYDPHFENPSIPGVKSAGTWEEIADYVFYDRG